MTRLSSRVSSLRSGGEYRVGRPGADIACGALIVYADFSDPFCHLVSRRVDVLRAAGVEVDWRAVQTASRLPVTCARDAARLTQLSRRSDELAGLLVAGEERSSARPGFVPNTGAAVAAYAEAYGAGVADEVRRLLFALYWEHGVDIGNPNELRAPLAPVILSGSSSSDPLRRFGYAVGVSRGPITTAAWRRIRSWRGEWQQLGEADVPVVCRGTGPALSGAAGLRCLVKEMGRIDASLDARRPHAVAEPPDLPPPVGWVSEVGGRWGRPRWAIEDFGGAHVGS
jgi:hypothetical protein